MSKKDPIDKFIAAQSEFIDAQIALRAAPLEPSHRNDTAACRSRMETARRALKKALEGLLIDKHAWE